MRKRVGRKTRLVPLLERTDLGPTPHRVDAEKGIIYDVKVLGLESRNGRRYTRRALAEALHRYEGLPVNVDHPPEGQHNRPRRVADRLGKLTEAKIGADGIRADLRFNPRHPIADQLVWFAQHQPEALGLSHNADGKVRRQGGEVLVEAIPNVRSADLVCEPATTRSLYESRETMADDLEDDGTEVETPAPGGKGEASEIDHGCEMICTILKGDEDSKTKREKVAKILDLILGMAEDGEEEETTEQFRPAPKPRKKAKPAGGGDDEVTQLREQLDQYKVAERLQKKRNLARSLVKKAGLAKELVTKVFLEQLERQPSRKDMEALIEDRRSFTPGRKPRAPGHGGGGTALDKKGFVTQLRGF
jgi:hypothetical protein